MAEHRGTDHPTGAALAVLAGMAVISLVDSFIAMLSDLAGLWQFHLLRTCIALPLLWAFCAWRGQNLRPKSYVNVALRSLFISTAMVVYFGSLGVLPVAQAAAGLFTSPIFVILISIFALRMRIGPFRIAAVALGFLGTLLVLGPEARGLGLFSLVPVFAGFFYALGALATRHLCGEEDLAPLVFGSFLFLGIWGLIGSIVLALVDPVVPDGPARFLLLPWQPSTTLMWVLIAVQAVGALIGVIFLTRGYQLAEASFVAVWEYSLLVFAAFWGVLLFGQAVSLTTGVGIALILASGLLLAKSAARARHASAVA
ncbi:MAG: DMT family transporter [Pseudomonadota bacterium]